MSLRDMLTMVTNGDLAKVGEIGNTLMTSFHESRADAQDIKARLAELEAHGSAVNASLGQLGTHLDLIAQSLAGIGNALGAQARELAQIREQLAAADPRPPSPQINGAAEAHP